MYKMMMFFRWLLLSMSPFYVKAENIEVTQAVQQMSESCVQHDSLKGQLEPHVDLVE